MRKIVYSVAMSLDGFVAGPNGELDWIPKDTEFDFEALFARFDTVLMGRKSFEAAQVQDGGGAMPGMTSVVVSRTLKAKDHKGVTVISDDVKKRVSELRAASGKDIWLFGGGELFASLLDMRLVDGVGVAVIPALLGGGVPVAAALKSRKVLKYVSQRVYQTTGTVWLEYVVEPGGK